MPPPFLLNYAEKVYFRRLERSKIASYRKSRLGYQLSVAYKVLNQARSGGYLRRLIGRLAPEGSFLTVDSLCL